MDRRDILEKLREMTECDSLTEDSQLESTEEWDSMANISLIAIADEVFSKKITFDTIGKFKTIKDIIDFLVI